MKKRNQRPSAPIPETEDSWEKVAATCQNCERAFEDLRISFSGEVIVGASEICPKCSQCASLPVLNLPEKVNRDEPLHKTERRLSEDEAKSLSAEIAAKLEALAILADNGDERAAVILADLSYKGACHLQRIADRKPEILRPLARKCVVWPALIGPKKASAEWNDHLILSLEIGADVTGTKWNPNAPSTMVAMAMHAWLSSNCSELGLPKLSTETIELWFIKGWDALLFKTKGKPQEHPLLRDYVVSVSAKHNNPTAAIQRDGVKTALKQAYRNYATARILID